MLPKFPIVQNVSSDIFLLERVFPVISYTYLMRIMGLPNGYFSDQNEPFMDVTDLVP